MSNDILNALIKQLLASQWWHITTSIGVHWVLRIVNKQLLTAYQQYKFMGWYDTNLGKNEIKYKND